MPQSGPVVCQLVHTLNLGGAELLAVTIGRHLSATCRVIFACLDEPGEQVAELRQAGFAVHTIGRRAGFDAGCVRRLARLFGHEQVEVVHAHQYTPFFYAALARASAWRGLSRRPRIVFTEHGRLQPDYPRRKRMIANRFLLGRQDHVVAVGQAVRQALIDNEGLPAERIRTVYNGVNFAAFHTGSARDAVRARVRGELGLPPDAVVLMQVARLVDVKDHLTAVRAIGRLCVGSPVVLCIVGDGPERSAIEHEIRTLQLEPRVLMLGQRRDVPDLLAAADIGLLTSTTEGIPLAAIEALGAGLAFIGTHVGGMHEVVTPDCGILVPPADPQALADAIAQLVGDRPRLQSLARAGIIHVGALFDQQRMLADYQHLVGEAG